MIRWTGFVIAHRKRIVAAWLVLFVLGGLAAANLGGLLSNRFSVPGSESERGLNLLRDRMGDRSDGVVHARRDRGRHARPTARRWSPRRSGRAQGRDGRQGRTAPARRAAGVVYVQINTPLENAGRVEA